MKYLIYRFLPKKHIGSQEESTPAVILEMEVEENLLS